MHNQEKELGLMAVEVYGVLLDLVAAVKANDKDSIGECLKKVDDISESLKFINEWREERKKQGYPA
jgi:hypothetical protein